MLWKKVDYNYKDMKFLIQKEVFKKFPNLIIAIPIIRGFDNSKAKKESLKFLREQEKYLKRKFTLDNLHKDKRVTVYLEAFKKFGADPEKILPTHVAMAKRVLEGDQIPDINPLVNIYNGLSLHDLTPFGGENLDTLYGNFILSFAKGNEQWIGIGAQKSKSPKKGELVWGDDYDLSTRALNWRQCDRTKLTEKSQNGYFIMDGFAEVNEDIIKKAADNFIKTATKLTGGKATVLWLDKNHPEVESPFVTKSLSQTEKDKLDAQYLPRPIRTKPQGTIKTEPKRYFGPAKEIIKSLAQATALKEGSINLDSPVHPAHGDYSTNIALKLKVSPNEIKDKLEKDADLNKIVSKIKIENNFINFHLSNQVLHDNLSEIIKKKESFGQSEVGKGKTVVIDYSSPNIAKRFGIGHLRSTIIGQALYNLYSFIGWRAIGDNHLGDWGTQFGVLIYMVEKENLNPTKLSVDDWEKLYVEFHTLEEKNPSIRDSAREAFVRLEKGDKKAREIWQAAYDTSLSEYDRIYKRLGVKIDYSYGESFYEDKMAAAITAAKEKGVTVESEGALAIEFDKKYHLPSNLLVKTNGTTTYLTRDLALMFFRKRQWNPDLQIFEVGNDQKLYFQQVFALAEMMGLFKLNQLHHVAHGMIRFKEGKMSTRKGKTIKLEEVLEEAVEKAKKLGSDTDALAEKVGIGALKYNDLKRDPTKDIIFDWDEIINMEGNSGPYLQYTYARTQSVSKKSKSKPSGVIASETKLFLNSEESLLLRHLIKFPEIIITSAENFTPNTLCNYLYDLAQKYNSFYNKHKIISVVASEAKQSEFRLLLTEATGQILSNGLKLLGIETPEKM